MMPSPRTASLESAVWRALMLVSYCSFISCTSPATPPTATVDERVVKPLFPAARAKPTAAASVLHEPEDERAPPRSPEWIGEPRSVEPELQRYLDEIQRALDPSTLAYLLDQPERRLPPMATSGLPFPLASARPPSAPEATKTGQHSAHQAPVENLKVAKVRAFTFNYLLKNSRAGFAAALGDDGRYASSVNLPGVELDEATRTLLFSALTAPDERPGTSPCGEHYEHAYVFYDENDTPIAQFAVGDVCDIWTLTTHDIPEQARPIMQRVCEQSGVGLCMADEDLRARVWAAYNDRELVQRRLDAYPRRYRYRAPPIDVELRLSELTRRDKRLLCVWNDHHLSTIYSRRGRSHARIASWRQDVADPPAGQRHLFRKQGWDECVAEFPACDLKIAEVLRCQAHAQKGDPFLHYRKTPKHCAEQRQCLWGFETTIAEKPPKSWSQSD